MRLVALFFVGVLLCNCLPHLVAGLQGQAFPTPFARPRGVGVSSPFANFAWGMANLCTALSILARRPTQLGLNPQCLAMAVGAVLLGSYLSHHFAKQRVRREAAAKAA